MFCMEPTAVWVLTYLWLPLAWITCTCKQSSLELRLSKYTSWKNIIPFEIISLFLISFLMATNNQWNYEIYWLWMLRIIVLIFHFQIKSFKNGLWISISTISSYFCSKVNVIFFYMLFYHSKPASLSDYAIRINWKLNYQKYFIHASKSHVDIWESIVWRQKHHSSWLIFFFRIFSWLFISIIQEPYPNKQCNLLWNLIHHFHQNSQARGAIKVTTPDTPAHIQ